MVLPRTPNQLDTVAIGMRSLDLPEETMVLSKFVRRLDTESRSLVLANPAATNPPLVDAVARVFDDQPVSVTVEDIPTESRDQIVVRREDEVLARSTVNEFLDSILLADTDLYTSGARSLSEADLPAVMEALEGTRFTMDDDSDANRGKLLFVAMSRYIEKLAADHTGGTLRTGFQYLSRLRDEHGTAEAYRALGEAPVDVHVYGVPDMEPPEDIDVTVHEGESQSYRENWFVVFEPPETEPDAGMALVCSQLGPNSWDGFWTGDGDLVAEIAQAIRNDL